MESKSVADSLAVLGHEGRLLVFRLLMRRAPQGVRPGEIAEALGFKDNTLSHYLSDLERVGLVQAERQGRSIYYSVDTDRTGTLLDYLVRDCCRGRPDICAPFLPKSNDREDPAMQTRPLNVLFICSGNSARSIFAEAILNSVSNDRFRSYSAGTRPGSTLNPHAVEMLARAGLDVSGLRSKHVSEFQQPDAPRMDFVFTVCDAAAMEECAPWPGQAMTAHWGVPDPVKATGTEAEKALAFAKAYSELNRRITAFAALPFDQLAPLSLQHRLDDIGRGNI